MRVRDHKAEYARRIARGSARGLSRSQARGHPNVVETAVRSAGRPLEDARIQLALRVLRQERNFAKAAKAAKISPERLRKFGVERGFIEKAGRQWRTRVDLPRRMLIFSNGKSLAITVANFQSASLVGRYMAAALLGNQRSLGPRTVHRSVGPRRHGQRAPLRDPTERPLSAVSRR